MFNLPAVNGYSLKRAPLAQALAQVQFPIQARLATLEGIAPIQDGLRHRYPYLEPEQTQTLQIQLGPQGAAPAFNQLSTGRFVFRDDEGFSVIVGAENVNLTADANYKGADDFKQRFEEVLSVLQDNLPMARCDRIAARYLDVAALPLGDTAAWTRWFRPEVTGWPAIDGVVNGGLVQSALNQVQLVAPPENELSIFPGDVTAVVRTGLVPAGAVIGAIPPVQVETPAYVIDMDLFTEHAQKWSHQALSEQFAALHTQIDRFFRWTLTDEGAEAFGLEEDL